MKMSGESLSRSALGELNHTISSFLPEKLASDVIHLAMTNHCMLYLRLSTVTRAYYAIAYIS